MAEDSANQDRRLSGQPQNTHGLRWHRRRSRLKREFHTRRVTETHRELPRFAEIGSHCAY